MVGNKIDLGIKTKVKHILSKTEREAWAKVTHITFVFDELKHHPKNIFNHLSLNKFKFSISLKTLQFLDFLNFF